MFIFSKRCKFVQTRKYPKHLSIKTISKIASTVVGLAAIAYLLNCLWSMKGSGHIVPFSIFHKTVDASCFFFEDAKATKLEAISDRSIFLVASACELLDLRKICTVESAANTHPDWTIHIILYGHVKGNRNSKYYYTFLSKLEAYQNVLITSIDLREYFIGTPLEPLLTPESLKEIEFPEYFVSDLVKIATLYNHGGVYLSWAVVVERSLRTLSNDFFVQEPGKKVSSTILRLSNSEVRKEVINKIIRYEKYHKYYIKRVHDADGTIALKKARSLMQRVCARQHQVPPGRSSGQCRWSIFRYGYGSEVNACYYKSRLLNFLVIIYIN